MERVGTINLKATILTKYNSYGTQKTLNIKSHCIYSDNKLAQLVPLIDLMFLQHNQQHLRNIVGEF